MEARADGCDDSLLLFLEGELSLARLSLCSTFILALILGGECSGKGSLGKLCVHGCTGRGRRWRRRSRHEEEAECRRL